mmetsp:Transcript_9488/g.27124  ORF Transcript_9488/g.27124 Transcript_9488/m.27124 type:complete len:236 (-) Transcript_9488:263-970(-)|eukprot:CAMPEP_0117659960 /NCGR_PEP_ID=MMETSP0804-20121206/6709_1 /TAXON_ID=1074897 /ORGANISM="Tetraselmis astigmatica, Strain CCMP880" /LENGTH=235 /DNA_ID=CAMNT_0005466649 /DNA_START=103 /DNA_END=810 /DNA_ORIENTATION=-
MDTDAEAAMTTEAGRVPRAGRRQGRRATADEGAEGNSQTGPNTPPDASEGGGPQERAGNSVAAQESVPEGRNKGWGADSTPAVVENDGQGFTGVSRRKAQQMQEEAQQDKTSGLRNRWKHDADADNAETILEIPELDGDNQEDITFQVAEAPRARNNRMQTMAELDNDQQYNLPSNSDIDIDLSLLTVVLCSSEQVEEDDHIWEPDILFTDVASELTIEAEASETENVDEGAPTS